MKKTLLLMLMTLTCLGFVFAAQGVTDGTGPNHDAVVAAGGQEGDGAAQGTGVMVQAGNYNGQNGQLVRVEKEDSKIRLRVQNATADCECNLTQAQVQNQTRFYMGLSNGQNAEVKVMPNTASETALERLRLKNCDGNCTIELKEVGQGNAIRAAYEIQTQRQSKVLGLFKAQMQVQAQVDAETGELIRVNKPWWAFLASEPEEE